MTTIEDSIEPRELSKGSIGTQAELGEGVIYNRGSLWWIDILGAKVFRHEFKTKKYSEWNISHLCSYPSAIIPTIVPELFIIPCNQNIILWNYKTNTINQILYDNSLLSDDDPLKIPKDVRFNDAKLDPKGRLFVGTMDNFDRPCRAKLYRLDDSRSNDLTGQRTYSLTPVIEPVTLSNGLGWSPDGSEFYYIDTLINTICGRNTSQAAIKLNVTIA